MEASLRVGSWICVVAGFACAGTAWGQANAPVGAPASDVKPAASATPADPLASSGDVSALLAPICEKNKVPALVASLIEGDTIKLHGATGIRTRGSDAAAQGQDADAASKNDRPLLTGASFKVLHTPFGVRGGGDGKESPANRGATYACGWGVFERAWAGGRVLTHSGSNTMWYCTVWIAPERNIAVMAACNQGGDAGAKATDQAVGALIQQLAK